MWVSTDRKPALEYAWCNQGAARGHAWGYRGVDELTAWCHQGVYILVLPGCEMGDPGATRV